MKIQLDLIKYKSNLRITTEGGKNLIWDRIRKKYLTPTPEEIVRQLFVEFLIEDLQYSPIKIGIERKLIVNDMTRRFDIFVVDKFIKPYLLIECKAPEIPLSNAVFEQLSQYNQVIKVPYLIITNGLDTIVAALNYDDNTYQFLQEIPPPN